jgi:hypothetical protein
MTINFSLDWEEYFAAQEYFLYSRSRLTPEYLQGGALILVGAVLFSMGDRALLPATAMILGLAVIFFTPYVRRWASRRKWFREPLFHTLHQVSASEDGVYFRMGIIESNLVWHYYQRFTESPDGFLLIYGNDSFNYLPKRAFASPEMIDQFRALAAKKLPEARNR